MRVRILSAVCALLCVVGSLLLTRCADKSTDPPSDGPKDYVVYGWNRYGSSLVGYHTRTGAIDSIPLPFRDISGLKASPDGRKLYFNRLVGVSALDVASGEIVFDLPCGEVWDIVHSPDGNMIALLSDSLIILRASDHSVVYRDSSVTVTGLFSSDSRFFYYKRGFYADPPARCTVACVEANSGSTLWRRGVRSSLGRFAMSPKDDGRLVGYGNGTLRVYDIAGDTILFEHSLGLTGYEAVASPDGTRLFLTIPGDIDWPPAPYTFAVYDFPGNRMLDSVRIPAIATERCIGKAYVPGGYLAMTPDGYLFAAQAPHGVNPQVLEGLVVYNPAKPDTAKFICIGRHMLFLTCQTMP